ncbi:hypothetical protein ACVWWP_001840 [Bradyrhizobium sp. LM3.6]
MRHPLDIVAMFAALWLLASMVLDALTPKELTAVMIGIAIGPAVVITAVFYYLRCPRLDFVVMFAALWLISDIGIAFISPTQLPHFLIALGLRAGAADRHRAALATLPAPPRAAARAVGQTGLAR